jgi:sugar phosphate isomerase/epimerase
MYSEDIRIGTLVSGSDNAAGYIKQILPYGFESFSLTFWQKVDGDVARIAAEVRDVLADSGAVISSVSCFGNPLEYNEMAQATRDGWATLIDNAALFGCDLVTGFAGRLVDKPIDASIPRYVEVYGDLAKRAADKGVRLAFENCDMGGSWRGGDWNMAQTPDAWDLMFDALPADNIGLQWEPCHQMVKLIDPIPQLRKYVKKVFHVHGKDATVQWDVIREHGILGPVPFAYHRTPGFGDSNWTDIISILRQGGFTGSIDIEGWHDPVYRDTLEMMGQVRGLNYLKDCRGGSFVPNPQLAKA